ncbi:MAG TPA: outer membrane protein transport protein [Methylotenera sp.]|nr:outer membrane protein transport protein [Methylotenera sp.]HPV44337.1 outer membrane protein transport protein [Methylotenera sp.]
MKKIVISFVIFTTPIAAQAAGFALIEQSGSGMGNAYAGGSAIAEDASTIFFNPAGMTYIEGTQAVGALHLIKPNAEFNNKGSVAGAGKPLGDEGPNAGDLALVPNFYFMTEISPSIKVGVGINAPFGLKTEYDKEWLGRFQADMSEVKTININPSIAFKVNDRLSLGVGVSVMRAEATLTRAVNFGAAGQGSVKIEGDDWGFGFNLGAIYQATTDTRIGVAYRSKVEQHLEGDAKFRRPTNILPPAVLAATANGDVKADVSLPGSLSLSAFSRVNDKWDLMGDVTWTRWSQFEELAVYRDNGTLLTVTPENWENTMRYSIGANYHYSDAVKLRAGLAYDEEAIKDEFRTARIPGNDRKWLSLGASYVMSPASKFDVGYAHLFISDAEIDDNQIATGNGRVRGDYEGSVDILSFQYTHNF